MPIRHPLQKKSREDSKNLVPEERAQEALERAPLVESAPPSVFTTLRAWVILHMGRTAGRVFSYIVAIGATLGFIYGNSIVESATDKVASYREASSSMQQGLYELIALKDHDCRDPFTRERFTKALDLLQTGLLFTLKHHFSGKFLPNYTMDAFYGYVAYCQEVYFFCISNGKIPKFLKDREEVLRLLKDAFATMPKTRIGVFYYWALASFGLSSIYRDPQQDVLL